MAQGREKENIQEEHLESDLLRETQELRVLDFGLTTWKQKEIQLLRDVKEKNQQ